MLRIGFPVQPFGKEIPSNVLTVGAMSQIEIYSSVRPCLMPLPQNNKGTCVS